MYSNDQLIMIIIHLKYKQKADVVLPFSHNGYYGVAFVATLKIRWKNHLLVIVGITSLI